MLSLQKVFCLNLSNSQGGETCIQRGRGGRKEIIILAYHRKVAPYLWEAAQELTVGKGEDMAPNASYIAEEKNTF